MQSLQLQGKGTTRKWRRAKTVEPGDPQESTLVDRMFTVAKRNTLWGGDITYIPVGQGWLEQAVGREHPGAGLVFHDDQGVAIHVTRVPTLPAAAWHHPVGFPARQPLRQRSIRILLENLETRTRHRAKKLGQTGGEAGDFQVHRTVLQPQAHALRTGIPIPAKNTSASPYKILNRKSNLT